MPIKRETFPSPQEVMVMESGYLNRLKKIKKKKQGVISFILRHLIHIENM